MFPEPMFPGTYVPRFTANVLNFACVRVRMCVFACKRERVRAHVFALGKGSPTCMCACMRACVRALVRAFVRALVRARVYMCACVCA